MAELDDELIARVIDWCTEAGRPATAAEVRAALAPLAWDELLAARAFLADPPPARPLGPQALADLARGFAPRAPAESAREGSVPKPGAAPEGEGAAAVPGQKPARRTRKQRVLPAAPVVRRARDRRPAPVGGAPAPPPLPLPLVDELRLSEGRAVLERLLRRLGARRKAMAAALAAGWRRPDGTAPGPQDLESLLAHHGLARAFDRRERELLLHALRVAGGVATRAAASLELELAEFRQALSHTGAEAEAGRIRAERSLQVLQQASTLSERVHLLLSDEERLADLGVLPVVLADLSARLPEHLRALRASTPARYLTPALARSLSVPRLAAETLVRRFALSIEEVRSVPPRPRSGGGRAVGPGSAPAPRSPGRPAGRSAPRSSAPWSDGVRSGAPRSRSGEGHAIDPERVPAPRSHSGRPATSAPRSAGQRHSGPPRAGPPRSGPPRSGPPRGPRPAGPRRTR